MRLLKQAAIVAIKLHSLAELLKHILGPVACRAPFMFTGGKHQVLIKKKLSSFIHRSLRLLYTHQCRTTIRNYFRLKHL